MRLSLLRVTLSLVLVTSFSLCLSHPPVYAQSDRSQGGGSPLTTSAGVTDALPETVSVFFVDRGLPESLARRAQTHPTPRLLESLLREVGDRDRAAAFLRQHPRVQVLLRSTGRLGGFFSDAAVSARKTSGSLNSVTFAEAGYTTPWASPDDAFSLEHPPEPAGDVNGDGFNDWIQTYRSVANPETAAPSDVTDRTYLTFGGASLDGFRDVAYDHEMVQAGDLNDDGYADAIAFENGRASATLFVGSSAGYASTSSAFAIGDRVETSMRPGDLDGDGFDDVGLITYEASNAPVLHVLFGASQASDVTRQTYPLPLPNESVFVRNQTGSLGPDAGAQIYTTSSLGFQELEIRRWKIGSDRSLSLEQTVRSTEITNTADVFVHDISNDGIPDLVIDRFGSLYGVEVSGSGMLSESVTFIFDLFGASLLPVGDLDGNGTPEYYTSRNDGQHTLFFTEGNLLESGSSFVGENISELLESRVFVEDAPGAIGDVDGDGKDDLIFTAGTDQEAGV